MKLFADFMPRAYAEIKGGKDFPEILGRVYFYEASYGGVLIEAEVFGLPDMGTPDTPAFYGFHIHENGDCSGDFSKTGNHYNPKDMEHPHHAGDLPALLSNDGYAWMVFYNHFLNLQDVIGRSMVIHKNPDDFMTQPSGNSGEKIGCGVIKFIENL